MAALIAGDLKLALSCFTPGSVKKQRATIESLGMSKMKNIAEQVNSIQKDTQDKKQQNIE